jgi:very-short-patch-repair endonuclease
VIARLPIPIAGRTGPTFACCGAPYRGEPRHECKANESPLPRVVVNTALPEDVIEFRDGKRVLGAIVNVGKRVPMKGRHARGDAVCDALAEQMRGLGLDVVREHRFAPSRRWRFDLAVVALKLAVEVDGGAFTGGHSRGAAYERECEKFNTAVLLGWRVFRVTPRMVKQGPALALVKSAVEVVK